MDVPILLVLRFQFMPFLHGAIYNGHLQELFVPEVLMIFMDKYMKME